MYMLPEGVAFAHDARNLAMLRQPGLRPSRTRVAAAVRRVLFLGEKLSVLVRLVPLSP